MSIYNNIYDKDALERFKCTASDVAALGSKGIEIYMDAASTMLKKFNVEDLLNIGSKCGCVGRCNCYDREYMDELYGSCCGPESSTTDLKLVASLGEVRQMMFTVENNRDTECTYNVSVADLIDQNGKVISPDGIIAIAKADGVLKAGESASINFAVSTGSNKAKADTANRLESSGVYSTEFAVKGEGIDGKLSFGMWVQQADLSSGLILSDPCKPRKSTVVEFRNCDCCDGYGRGASKKYYRN